MNFNRASLSLRETYFLISFVSLFMFSLPVQLHFPWEASLFYTVRSRTWPLYLHRALQFSRLWPCQRCHMPFQMQPLQLLPAWGHSRSALLRVHCWHDLAGDYTWDPKCLSRHTTTRIISAPYDYLNKSRNKKSSVCGGNFLKMGIKTNMRCGVASHYWALHVIHYFPTWPAPHTLEKLLSGSLPTGLPTAYFSIL